MPPLKKTLSQEYFDKGTRAYRTNLAQAITFFETSVRYDPANTQAALKLKEAKVAREKLDKIEQRHAQAVASACGATLSLACTASLRVYFGAEFLVHPLAQVDRPLALQLRLLVAGLQRQHAIPLVDRLVQVLALERLRGFALVAPRQRLRASHRAASTASRLPGSRSAASRYAS